MMVEIMAQQAESCGVIDLPISRVDKDLEEQEKGIVWSFRGVEVKNCILHALILYM